MDYSLKKHLDIKWPISTEDHGKVLAKCFRYRSVKSFPFVFEEVAWRRLTVGLKSNPVDIIRHDWLCSGYKWSVELVLNSGNYEPPALRNFQGCEDSFTDALFDACLRLNI